MIVVSGYFGKKLTGAYRAPQLENCFFFSNNSEMKSVVENQGWTFLYEHMPVSSESRIASLQSKYVKFLQFDKNKIGWVPGQAILYFDHKFEVKKEHIEKIERLCESHLLIRNTPKEKITIQDEIDAALGQKRYAEVMGETIEWVNTKIRSGKYSPRNRIMNTGLIFYKEVEKIQNLCSEVFEGCWLIGQPECQIIWGILSQKYETNITRINWTELDIVWNEPPIVVQSYNLKL
jgi:hypothetical protein